MPTSADDSAAKSTSQKGNVPLDDTPLEYSLQLMGENGGRAAKCNCCKNPINVKNEVRIKVHKPGSLHGSSSTKFFHPECISKYPGAPDSKAFVDSILVDETNAKHLDTVEGKNKLVQDMNKDARLKNTEPKQKNGTLEKIDMPDPEAAIEIDESYWKSGWENILPENVEILDMLIDVIKCYGERAAKGDEYTKIVSGAWSEYYVKVIDFIVGVKEEITVEVAEALHHTSKGIISEEIADCIAMYVSDGFNVIIANIHEGDEKADEWEEKVATYGDAATLKGYKDEDDDDKEGMGDADVKSDALEEQQFNDAIELSQMEAGSDEDTEEVEKKVGEVSVKAAEEMDDDKDEPKQNEEEV